MILLWLIEHVGFEPAWIGHSIKPKDKKKKNTKGRELRWVALMIGKYSVHTTIDLKNENCDGRGYRLVGNTKKEEVGAILSRALEPDFLT